jgi:hypothetical protein
VIWVGAERKNFLLWDSTAPTTPNLARRAVGFGSLELAHCPHPVSGFLPETRPYALMNSTGINVRYPAYHGLNADSVQCRRCANNRHSSVVRCASSFRLRPERNRHGVPKLEGSDHVLRRGLVFLEMSRFEMGLICVVVCVYLEHRDMGRIVFVGYGI